MDPWFYFGEFINFPHYQRLIPNYPAERLMWILPGLILTRIFSPVYGLLALHVVFYWLSVFSMYYLVEHFTDTRTALLTSCLLGCHPFFLGANGWSYLDGACIAYFLLAFAFIVKAESFRFRRFYFFMAGLSWASLVYTYPLWLVLTPCCFYLYFVTAHEDGVAFVKTLRQRIVPFVTFFSLGIAILTCCLQTVHVLSYGYGTGFFFRDNIVSAFSFSTMKMPPWSSRDYAWIPSASWLVFPALAFLVCIGLLLRHMRGAIKLGSAAKASVLIYLYALCLLVTMTLHPPRLLEYEYVASMLIPSLFLMMGLTILRVPDKWLGPRLYLLLVLCCAICLLPLWKVNLYRVALIHGLAFAYAIGVAGIGIRLFFPRTNLSWLMLLFTLSFVSFGLVPLQAGAAWQFKYNGMGQTKRIASAIALIENRLPREAYPTFWIDDYNSELAAEYRAIMCGFLAHGFSMLRYPEADADRIYKPGTFLVLITENRDAFDGANEAMIRAGMPLSLYGQDLITGGGISYWLTYVRVSGAQKLQSGETAGTRSN